MYTYVKVKSPATLANFGPGYDVFGIALEEPYDVVELELTDGKSTVENVNFELPTSINRNVASYAAMQIFDRFAKDVNFNMKITKGVRPASGMGSSGASSVGGALSAERILGRDSDEEVIMAAAQGEWISSGHAHADNVAPCYLGGFTSIVSLEPFNIFRIMPEGLRIVAVLPDVRVSTKEARKILPKSVPMEDAVHNVSMSSYVIYSLMRGEYSNLRVALEDKLSIPYRKQLLPGYEDAHRAAIENGAVAFSLGGSGPTVFAIVEDDGKNVARSIKDAFMEKGIDSKDYITKVGSGAEILSLE